MPCGCGVVDPQPSVRVSINGACISNGGTVDLGTVLINSLLSVTVYVRNVGEEELILAEPIRISGSKFSLGSSFTSTNLDSGNQASFSVSCDTSERGIFNGSLYFDTNDSSNATFDINVYFRVIEPDIYVSQNGTEVANGSTFDFGTTLAGTAVEKVFGVDNTGDANLVIDVPVAITGTAFCLSNTFNKLVIVENDYATFTLQQRALVTGVSNESVTITSNDPDESPYVINITGNVITPEADLSQADVGDIANYGNFNFGETLLGTPVSKQFTVTNNGSAELHVCDILLPEGFTLEEDFSDSIVSVSGGVTTFTVKLDANIEGFYSGRMSFTNDDLNENPYVVIVSGNVVTPEIRVYSSDAEYNTSDVVDFGSTPVGTSVLKEFTIQNRGTSVLSIPSGVVVNGEGFSVESDLSTTELGINETASFTIKLLAEVDHRGDYSSNLVIKNSDIDEGDFYLVLNGFVVTHPEVVVTVDGVDVQTGSTVDFGVTYEDVLVEKDFILSNTGVNASSALNIPDVTVPAGFDITKTVPINIPVNGQNSFTVSMGNTPGTHYGVIRFDTNDLDEESYTIVVKGIVQPVARCHLSYSGLSITNGGSFEFGSTDVGINIDKTFVITNIGSATLLASNLVVPEGFTIISELPPVINPGQSISFAVRLSGRYVGDYAGKISFITNDMDNTKFEFNVDGSVVFHPDNSISNLALWLDGKSIIEEVGTVTSKWTDISGAGRDFWQYESSSFNPVRTNNGLYFDGIDDYMASNYRVSAGDKTLAVIVKFDSIENHDQLIGVYEDKAHFYVGAEANTNRFIAQYGDGEVMKGVPSLNAGQYHTVILRGIENVIDVFVDGQSVATVSGYSNFTSTNNFYIGKTDGDKRYIKGEVSSVIVYHRGITNDDCVNLHRYLINRFNV